MVVFTQILIVAALFFLGISTIRKTQKYTLDHAFNMKNLELQRLKSEQENRLLDQKILIGQGANESIKNATQILGQKIVELQKTIFFLLSNKKTH